jgi:hypothetical protein
MPETTNIIPSAAADARKLRLIEEAAARPRRYSVYKIMEALRTIGAYSQIKALLEQNDLWDRIVVIGALPSDNPYFTQYYPAVAEAISQIAPDADIEALLEECEERE